MEQHNPEMIEVAWTTTTTEEFQFRIPRSEFEEHKNELEDYLAEYEDEQGCLGTLTRSDIRVISQRYCRFCGQEAGGNAHRISAAESVTNPWVCENCWDQRLD